MLGIETSSRSLKYTVGMVYLHAKKPELTLQEIFASFIVYNFAQAVAWGVDTSKGRFKYKRHVNFSDAVELCCAFLRKPVGDLCALLTRNLIPYRPDWSFPRPKIANNRIAFPYRPARQTAQRLFFIFGGGVKGADSHSSAYKGSIEEWLPVKNIVKGMVATKDGRFVKILEVLPVNFYMLSEMERKNIIYYFSSYLKVAPDNLQMVVRTSKADLEEYVAMMRRYYETESNEQCREMIEDNIQEVQRVASVEAITHRFFLVFAYEPRMRAHGNSIGGIADRLGEEAETARRYLDMCGLEVLEPHYADNMVLDVLYEALNKKTSRHVKLPDGVFDMLTEVHGVYE